MTSRFISADMTLYQALNQGVLLNFASCLMLTWISNIKFKHDVPKCLLSPLDVPDLSHVSFLTFVPIGNGTIIHSDSHFKHDSFWFSSFYHSNTSSNPVCSSFKMQPEYCDLLFQRGLLNSSSGVSLLKYLSLIQLFKALKDTFLSYNILRELAFMTFTN